MNWRPPGDHSGRGLRFGVKSWGEGGKRRLGATRLSDEPVPAGGRAGWMRKEVTRPKPARDQLGTAGMNRESQL